MNEPDTTPESGPVRYFTSDHRRCDESWASVEQAAESGDPAQAKAALESFDKAMQRHLDMEEQVLFPALEQATGMRGGPTFVMRAEHVQMRGVLGQMGSAATRGDWDGVLDLGDTLMILIQQHNMKEEGMLYPMAEHHLRDEWREVASRLERFGTA